METNISPTISNDLLIYYNMMQYDDALFHLCVHNEAKLNQPVIKT